MDLWRVVVHDALIHFIKKSLYCRDPVLKTETKGLRFVVMAELNGQKSELVELQIERWINDLFAQDLQQLGDVVGEGAFSITTENPCLVGFLDGLLYLESPAGFIGLINGQQPRGPQIAPSDAKYGLSFRGNP